MKRRTFYMLAGLGAAAGAAMLYTRSRASAESAPYDVLEKDGNFELRDYPDLAVARAYGSGADFDPAFRRLFRFISDRDIAMTTPVLIDRGADDVAMDFVLPAGQPLPRATDRGVTVGHREGGRVAALRFGGFMSRKREQRAIARLHEALAARGLRAADDPVIAYYDAPAVPPPLRRNEVLIRIE